MKFFRFLANGTIETVLHMRALKIDEIPLTLLNSTYKRPVYIYCISKDTNVFFLMHNDNSLPDNLTKSPLPVNQAVKRYFPDSRYVGDILLVATDDNNKIIRENWDHCILLNYELVTVEEKGQWRGTFMPIQEKMNEDDILTVDNNRNNDENDEEDDENVEDVDDVEYEAEDD